MKKILFLCTGNSCRSIIAEVLLNNLGKIRFQAFSAGSFPTGTVNPDSIKLLQQHGFATANLASKSWHDLSHIKFDIVITVCDNAAGETCPLYLGEAIKAHWGIPDPDKVTAENRPQAFAKAFNQLKSRIEKLLDLKETEITASQLNKIGAQTK